jgi:hypothetical protein
MHIFELHNGQLIMHQGEVARVEKVKQKRLIVQHASGKRYDTWPQYCSPAPEGSTFELAVPEAEGVTLGTVVKFTDGRNPGMYSVIGLQNGGTLKLAKLFGEDGNRYFHNVAKISIEVVSREDLKAWLIHTA